MIALIDLIKPDWFEAIGLLVALMLGIFGILLILRKRARRRWAPRSSPAHRREMELRRQKKYEELPPGQW